MCHDYGMSKKQTKKNEKVGNPDLVAGLQSLRFGNAAGKHDTRPNRQRTRATQKARAIRESE